MIGTCGRILTFEWRGASIYNQLQSYDELRVSANFMEEEWEKDELGYAAGMTLKIMVTLPMENRRLKEFHPCEGIRFVH